MKAQAALRALTVLAALLGAAACSSPRQAPVCSGPAFQLNAGLWTPAPGEIPSE